jgi:uncharacterized membrane protein YqgA involved in biofilm formation
MLGPTVNAIVIVACGLLGCFLIRGIPSRFDEILRKAIGISVFFIGIKGSLVNERVLLLIISLVSGAIIGELINLDAHMNRLGNWAESRFRVGSEGRSFSKGFISTSILYCTGSMAILGSMQSGLTGNHELLFTKSIIDGITAIFFAASMGIGVVFSAIPVFIYESVIVLGSMALKDIFTPDIIREMSAVGSLLVAAIGFNFLGVKEIKVANFIPAIFVPFVYMTIEGIFF